MTTVELKFEAPDARFEQCKLVTAENFDRFDARATEQDQWRSDAHTEITINKYKNVTIAEFRKLTLDHKSVYDNAGKPIRDINVCGEAK